MESLFIDNHSETFSSVDIHREDTIKALEHLYKRKRHGGTARATVFVILGTSSLIGTLSYKPSTVTINQGSAGSQTFQLSSGPGAANYIFIAFSTIMTITGITQAKKYSSDNLATVSNGYREGRGIPIEISSKLKRKDFK